MSDQARSSNVRVVGDEHAKTESHVAQRSSNVRPLDESEPLHGERHVAERSSNARPLRDRTIKQLNTSDRSSNAQRREDAPAGLVTLKLSDGPASKQIRGINVYTSGETVAMACEADGARSVTCVVQLPDGSTITPAVTAQAGTHTTHVTTGTPGDYWYAFSATNENGLISVKEQYFIVERNRVPRV